MSCLPWASWAAKKAAQIVGNSGGGSSGWDVLVVEASGYEALPLTADQQAWLTAQAEQERPILLKLVNDGKTFLSGFIDYFFLGDSFATHAYGNETCQLICSPDGVWTVYIAD